MKLPDEAIQAIENVFNILVQAKDDTRHNTGAELSHEMEVAINTDKFGRKFQLVLKLIVSEDEFLERGNIVTRNKRDRDVVPFKVIRKKKE